MNKNIVFLAALVVITASLGTNEAFGLIENTSYVLYSDTVFFVFDTGKNYEMKVVDGGVYHDEEFKFIDIDSMKVDPIKSNLDQLWVMGNLQSGERFWITWDIKSGESQPWVTGVFVYNGTNLTEDYTLLKLEKLFY